MKIDGKKYLEMCNALGHAKERNEVIRCGMWPKMQKYDRC